MEIITSNPIVYNNKVQLDTSLGEDLSGYKENLNYMEGVISDFSGSKEDEIYYTCDNKSYHKFDGADLYIGFDGEYYNAKGEKVKGFFKNVGKGFVAVAKGVGKGVAFVGKNIAKGTKFVVANIKKVVGKDARKGRKERRKNPKTGKAEDVIKFPIKPLSKDANGNWVSTGDSGEKTIIPATATITKNGETYKTTDIDTTNGGEIVQEGGNITKVLKEEEVVTLTDPSGKQEYYQPSDVIPSTELKQVEEEKGMSKTMKFSLIVGGSVLFIGVVAFLIYNSRKNK